MISIAVEVLGVLSRWLHITSAVLLIGGAVYARTVAVPALRTLAAEDRLRAWAVLAARFRPMVYAAVAGLLVSGTYALLAHPGHTRLYHIWFGVKMLLAAHVFAAAVLAVRPPEKDGDESQGVRRLSGVVVSGLVVLLIATYLRRIY
jgi:uncharacterized membrane protein